MVEKKGVFLDVDSSIVEKNLRFTENEDEARISQMFGGGEPHEPASKLIKPSPGFCIKTKEVGTNTKVFLNICETEHIPPPPKNLTEGELAELLETDSTDYRVPMSIAEVRLDKDQHGEEVKVIDIAINGQYLKKMQQTKLFKEFFLAIVMEAINHKYGIICVDDKIILKNKKAYGNLQMHRIKPRENDRIMGKSPIEESKPKITEISSETTVKEPEYKLFKKKDGQNCLYGEFKFPDVLSGEEITVDVGEDRILLEAKQRGYLLDIFVPCVVRQEGCSAVFEKSSKTLSLAMPLVGG